MKVVLLGPQRTPTVGRVMRSLELAGPVATITAGWQEREPDDGELGELLGAGGVNLLLYGRWLDVQERDPEYAAALRQVRQLQGELHGLYLGRLDHAARAVQQTQRSSASESLREESLSEAIEAVRALDARHLERIDELHAALHDGWPPHERPVVAEHRAAVAQLLRDAAALVVTGGHVGVLTEVLHVFNVAASLHSPVVAWSAGAMALSDRVVLFHDRAPQGPGHPEVLGRGLGVLRDVVPLPHARRRLLLEDAPRMAVFARRFAPAQCVLLEGGARLDFDADGGCPKSARVLGADGRVVTLEAA